MVVEWQSSPLVMGCRPLGLQDRGERTPDNNAPPFSGRPPFASHLATFLFFSFIGCNYTQPYPIKETN
ncbi:hypothetical protein [Pandoravirus japonicus]|uniref:Uncharacterized protein n=1 Tax=Pandoravirus japonicus TaxID=2823154 RepID=A0A811BQP7_9VIRU|nr:hypothetical protein [Pandoravirus japonicus]